MKQNKREKLG